MKLNLNSTISSTKPLFDYLKKQQDNQRFLKSIEITATFVTITFFMVFAIKPTLFTIMALKGDIESKKLLKSELKEKINQIILAQDLFSQVQEKYHLINSSLPDNPSFFDANNQIQQISLEDNIKLGKIGFNLSAISPGQTNPNLNNYRVSISIYAPFTSSLKLVNQLLASRRLLDIDSLEFSIGDTPEASTSGQPTDIGARFSAKYYYWTTQNAQK